MQNVHMPKAPKTVSRVQLGRRIRQFRDQNGITREQIANRLGWDLTKLSRVEQGSTTLAPAEVDVLVSMFDLTDTDATELRRLGKEARKRASYGKTPDWARTFVEWEQDSTEFLTWESELIPGLLQTADYARAVIDASVVAAQDDVDRMVADRLKRQELLTGSQLPEFAAVLSEAALRRMVGGTEVMKAQLDKLKELAALPHVTLQVLPFSSGAHAAMGSSFTVLRLRDEDLSVVYLEDLTSADYLEGTKHVRTYRLAFQRLQVAALGEPETVTFVKRVARELE